MKINHLGLVGALCAIGLLGNTSALAQQTANVAVTASVTGTCKFTGGGAIAFTLDQNSGADAAGTVSSSPAFWCTKGTTYSVTGDDGENSIAAGVRRMKNTAVGSTDFIPYSFSGTTATGSGSGKTTSIPLTLSAATVTNADFVNASAGSYTDTVTVTISP